jgi:hypothetical protein
MAFDSNQQRTLLFGGSSDSGELNGDTWQWDGTAWTQVEDTGPPVRQSHAMAYAADRNRTVLFGGSDASGTVLNDTWEWDATRWTHEQDIGPARSSMAMAFTGGSTILFGGNHLVGDDPTTTVFFGDTWGWDGQHWVERQDMGPQGRSQHAMAFDSTRNRLVLFGGTPAVGQVSQLGDTWEAIDPGTDHSGVVLTSIGLTHTVRQPLTGSLGLSGPAPSGGVTVVLSAENFPTGGFIPNGIVGVGNDPPWSVPISGGASGTTFRTLFPIDDSGIIIFKATFGGVTKTAAVDTDAA